MTGIGHLCTGLLLKAKCRQAPLPLLLLAAVAPDLLWVAFNLLRDAAATPVEIVHVGHPFSYIGDQHLVLQPWSHALASTTVLAAALGGLAFIAYRQLRVGLVVAVGVLGHWFLDFLVHDADLTVWTWEGALKVGPPFVLDANNPTRGLFTTHPLWGFALQTLLVLGCTLAFVRAYPVTQKAGRWKMWVAMVVLAAVALPIFVPGGTSKFVVGSTQLLLLALAEIIALGLAVSALARWSVGPTLSVGPLDRTHEEAVAFVHRLHMAIGLACFATAAMYMVQSMLDAQHAAGVGISSLVMAMAFAVSGRSLLHRNPGTLWAVAALGFVGAPLARAVWGAGSLGVPLLLMELALGFAAASLIRTLLRRNLAL